MKVLPAVVATALVSSVLFVGDPSRPMHEEAE
jgi:hypothetical protein